MKTPAAAMINSSCGQADIGESFDASAHRSAHGLERDVDGLKATNNSLGHAAGDRLLHQVVDTIRGHVRSYDLIVRYGGDEFLCGLLDIDMAAAVERFASVNADLAAIRHASVTAGIAELDAHDRLDGLIQRADEAMYRERARRGSRASNGDQ